MPGRRFSRWGLAAAVLAACLAAAPDLTGFTTAGTAAPAAYPVPVRQWAPDAARVAARLGELIVKPRVAGSRLATFQPVEREPGFQVKRVLPTGAAAVRVDDWREQLTRVQATAVAVGAYNAVREGAP